MATTSTSLSLPTFLILSTSNPKPYHFFNIRTSSTPFPPPSITLSPQPKFLVQNPLNHRKGERQSILRLHATSQEALVSEATTLVEKSQEIASSSDDGGSTIISTLLFIAFIGLSILTIGVIYIAATDFLQKREREKFEKEEEAKKKSGKKNRKKVRAKGGPRGFGQKIEEEDDDYDED